MSTRPAAAVPPARSSARPPASVGAVSFSDEVMARVALEPMPTPTRGLLVAVRDAAPGDAMATVWTAWHLATTRGARIGGWVRVRALALVVGVMLVLGTGGTIAAAAAVHVVAQVNGVRPSPADTRPAGDDRALPSPDVAPLEAAEPGWGVRSPVDDGGAYDLDVRPPLDRRAVTPDVPAAADADDDEQGAKEGHDGDDASGRRGPAATGGRRDSDDDADGARGSREEADDDDAPRSADSSDDQDAGGSDGDAKDADDDGDPGADAAPESGD